MSLFIGSYILLIILKPICDRIKNGRKVYCVIVGNVYFGIAALRYRTVGSDTDIYVRAFERLSEAPVLQAATYYEKDPFFWICLSVIGKITQNYTWLFIVVAALFCGAITYYIYKYSTDLCLSFIILLSLNLYQFSLTGMRQTIAMAFIILALIFLREDKIVKSIIFIVIASLFHSSALVILIIVLLRKIKIPIKMLWCLPFCGILVFVFNTPIALKLIKLVEERGYEVEELGNGVTMAFVIFCLFVLCICFAQSYKKVDEKYMQNYWLAFGAVFFEMLVPTQSIFFRIAFYFLLVFVTLLPNVVNSIINVKYRGVIRLGLYVLLSVQYLVFTIGSCNIIPYYTFWQM